MASKKRKGAKAGAKGAKGAAKVGAWAAPKARRVARKTAWKAVKVEAKLVRHALRSKEPRSARFLKYGFFALVGLAIGTVISRSGREDSSSSFTDTTGHHTPDAGSPASQRGQTWGSGNPTGTAGDATAGQTGVGAAPGEHQRPEDENRTGTERFYSDPSSGPLIGAQPRGQVGEVARAARGGRESHKDPDGEDPRTADVPHGNVEVNDSVAELRGVASEAQAQAAGELAAGVEGVGEVRNMINVSS